MANKYTRWAPTQYVPLPIDYYQQALAFKEKSTQESIDKLDAILQGYGAIQPIGKNAQALYEQTNTNLRNAVDVVAKQNLDTPKAQREIGKIINDPNTVDTYDKILTHAIEAAELRKNVNEYIKKNPKVNAAEAYEALNQLDLESGKAEEFNPNMFKKNFVLADYFDINKRIEEGIKMLHADSEAYKKIVEPYLLDGKETVLSRQKVREHVLNQLKTDPQIREQLARNIRFAGYQANPYNIDKGLTSLGEGYIEEFGKKQDELQASLGSLYTTIDGKTKKPRAMTDKEIETLRAGKTKEGLQFVMKERNILQGIEAIKAYKQPSEDPSAPDQWMAPDKIAGKVERDNIRFGFDQYAWHENATGEAWSPLYLAKVRANLMYSVRKRLQDDKMKTVMDLANAISMRYDTRESDPISPTKRKDYWKDNVKEMDKVLLDNNGAFRPENYENGLVKVQGKYYMPGDVYSSGSGTGISVPEPENPDEWEYKESSHYGGYKVGGSFKTYIRKGAKPVDKSVGTQKLFEAGKAQIADFLDKNSIGASYDLNKSEDLNAAVNAITAYKQRAETSYAPIYTTQSSSTPERKNRIRNNLNQSAVYVLDDNRKMVRVDQSKDDMDAIRTELDKKNSQVLTKPVSRQNKMFEVVNVGDKTYYIEGTPLAQNYAAVGNDMLYQMMNSKNAVSTLSDGSLFMKFMGKDGEFHSSVLAGGASQDAQDRLQATYDANVKSVMDQTGVSKAEAERAIKSQSTTSGKGFNVITSDNKSAAVDIPVLKYTIPGGKDSKGKALPDKVYYYTWGDVGPYKSKNGRDVINGIIQQGASRMNPEAILDNLRYLRAATKEGLVTDLPDDYTDFLDEDEVDYNDQ